MVELTVITAARRPARGMGSGRARRVVGLTMLLASVAVVGCSKGPARLAVVPVTGKVTFKGVPPDGALVVFHPTKPLPKQEGGLETPDPSGQVKPDGTFQLTTYDGNDGAPEGDYAVTIQWYKPVKSGADTKAGPNVIPTKYGTPDSTPWKAKVDKTATELPPQEIGG
ncbi:hypothetical protein EP7_000431 [Isosphaeraceae bacterium EP7]